MVSRRKMRRAVPGTPHWNGPGSHSAPTASPWRTRATTRPKRFCSSCCAELEPADSAGIHPARGPFVRPLLDVGREELRSWLRSHGHTWVEDATNSDVGVPRNRIRHRVLPALHAAMGADVTASLARCAEISRADAEWLDVLTDRATSHWCSAPPPD